MLFKIVNFYFFSSPLVVRKVVVSTMVISTVVGVYSCCFGDGYATGGYNGDNMASTLAQLNNPGSIAVDSNSDIYILDSGNNRVRKITFSTGIKSIFILSLFCIFH